MKKTFPAAALTAVLAVSALLALAAPLTAQMDNLTNLSVQWMRMPARNAATDSADVVVYNPAAVVRLGDGFHLNIGNQSLMRKPNHAYALPGLGDRSFSQDGLDAFLPNLYAAYTKGKWAVYGGFYISGGGAVADYPNGSLTTDMITLAVWNSPVLDEYGNPTSYLYQDLYPGAEGWYLKASSYYLTGTIGGAYALTESLSASFGLRYVGAVNKTKLGLTLVAAEGSDLPNLPLAYDTKDKASGLGFVAGLHYAVSPKLDLAAHYESRVKLDFETTVNRDDFGLAVDGAKNRRDLPAALYLGAGYRWTKKLHMLVDFNYWFQKAADWGLAAEDLGWSKIAGDCYAAGVGFSYDVSERVQVSAGTVFTKFLFDNKALYYQRLGEFEAPKGDNWNNGIGLAFKAAKGLTLNAALGGTFWKKTSILSSIEIPVEVKAHSYSLSIGADIDL
ncbi:MAG: hypothetical protein ABFD80_05740 [Acidobacteriota bacterium]